MGHRALDREIVGAGALLILAVAACSSGPIPTAAPTTAASHVAAPPTPSDSPTAGPSPTAEVPSTPPVLPAGGHFAPGTYSTLFEPALTLTLDSYGESYVDSPSWVDIEYEHDPGLYVQIVRLDQLYDPKNGPKPAPELCDICTTGGELIDVPGDLASWIAKQPGVAVLTPTTTVRIGGTDATQLDLRTDKVVSIGPLAGFDNGVGFGLAGGATRYRLIAVRVGGHQVLIAMSRGSSAVEAFDASMARARPLIDSIVWH